MVDQNSEIRRMSSATIVARKGMSRKSVGITKREEKVKILSHQMLRSEASTSDDGEILYKEATIVSESRKQLSDVWLIDSGVTWHMTSRREWFHTYERI